MIRITLQLHRGLIGVDGRRLTCPECGEQCLLTLRTLLDETGDEPSYIDCPWGHVWAEAAVPRRALADLFARVEQEDPELWAELLRLSAERGHLAM